MNILVAFKESQEVCSCSNGNTVDRRFDKINRRL